jgi:predicted kinase
MSHRRNKKLIINVGVPASGKSTGTRDYLAKNPNAVAVSRDDFRYGLRNSGVTEPKIEDMITELVDMTILKAFTRGLDVVVDATNLKESYINHFVELAKYRADVEFRIYDISLEKALERDKNRERSVGEHVIRKMFKQYRVLVETYPFQNIQKTPEWKQRFEHIKKTNSELPDCVLFDLDGTLALMNNRSPYDWDKVDNDDLNHVVAEQIKFHKSLGRTIIFFTGRDEESRGKTNEWIEFYGLHCDLMYMRKDGDPRRDNIVKKEMFNEHIVGKFHPVCVYDDRIQVVKMWYELGVFCYNVNQGMFEF